jgi:hypothetical protein
MSTLQLSGLKARPSSGLTLSRAPSPCLQRRGLTRLNGSNLQNRICTAETPLPADRHGGRREDSFYYSSRESPGRIKNLSPSVMHLIAEGMTLRSQRLCGEPGFWICEDQVPFMMMLQMMLAAWSPRSAALLRCL